MQQVNKKCALCEDKGGLLGPKKDKYKVFYLIRHHPILGLQLPSVANSAKLLDIKTEVRAYRRRYAPPQIFTASHSPSSERVKDLSLM